jgi:hypothetical protein
VALAFASPNEVGLLGKLPPVSAKRLDQTPVSLPRELPSDRTLALVVFKREQREEALGWINGLHLRQEPPFAWLKLPVWNDPGDESGRRHIEAQLMERHPSPSDRARMVPLFTDTRAFVRAAGLDGTDHVSVLVVDRAGNVLAKAQGPYDEGKAQALRATLLAQND